MGVAPGDLGTEKISYLHSIYLTYSDEAGTGKSQQTLPFKEVGEIEGK